MPELPEVETTRRGLSPEVTGRRVTRVVVREPRLRWAVAADLPARIQGQAVLTLDRRAKYLIFRFPLGAILVHLGMSGCLRLVPPDETPRRHDHVDLSLDSGVILRYHDPRRFGALLWTEDADRHPLLAGLGPEPLGDDFTAGWLAARASGRSVTVKSFLMDARIVVGVGNIYASESLFRARIHPASPVGRVGDADWMRLLVAVREVLTEAIAQGGTTLRDFVNGQGRPGYFQQSLRVYGRDGAPCPVCGTAIERWVLAQRASFLCPKCQPRLAG